MKKKQKTFFKTTNNNKKKMNYIKLHVKQSSEKKKMYLKKSYLTEVSNIFQINPSNYLMTLLMMNTLMMKIFLMKPMILPLLETTNIKISTI